VDTGKCCRSDPSKLLTGSDQGWDSMYWMSAGEFGQPVKAHLIARATLKVFPRPPIASSLTSLAKKPSPRWLLYQIFVGVKGSLQLCSEIRTSTTHSKGRSEFRRANRSRTDSTLARTSEKSRRENGLEKDGGTCLPTKVQMAANLFLREELFEVLGNGFRH